MTVPRLVLGLLSLTSVVAGSALAAPPRGFSAGPTPLFGSPGAYAPSQFIYPAPGVYGSTVFRPFAVPPLSISPSYNVPLPPAGWRDELTARVTVHLPADAKLWVDGKPTKQTGAVREFVTPPVLRAAQNYQYTFRAEWAQDGRAMSRERSVTVRATEAVTVDFSKP
jgi:uncharacterized protein (TIGR03000 family)